jgi:hypothetical protein
MEFPPVGGYCIDLTGVLVGKFLKIIKPPVQTDGLKYLQINVDARAVFARSNLLLIG